MSWSFEDREFMVRLPSHVDGKIDVFALLNQYNNVNVSAILLRSIRVISTEAHAHNLRQRLSMYDAQTLFTSQDKVLYRVWLAALPAKIHVNDKIGTSVDVTLNGDAFAASLLLEGALNIRMFDVEDIEVRLLNMPTGYEVYALGSYRPKESK